MLSTPIDKHGLSSHFFRSSLIYFICFKVSNIGMLHIFCKVYTYIFTVFWSYYKWYLKFFFLFPNIHCYYIKAQLTFCIMTLYPVTLLNSLLIVALLQILWDLPHRQPCHPQIEAVFCLFF